MLTLKKIFNFFKKHCIEVSLALFAVFLVFGMYDAKGEQFTRIDTGATRNTGTAQFKEGISRKPVLLTPTTASYTLDKANGDVYLINTHAVVGTNDSELSGVSIVLPDGTADDQYEGWQVTFVKVETILSGATPIIITTGGGKTENSGTSDYIACLNGNVTSFTTEPGRCYDLDAQGDSVTFVYQTALSGGTWWAVSGVTR